MLNKKVILCFIFNFFVFYNSDLKAFTCKWGCNKVTCKAKETAALCLEQCEPGEVKNCKAASDTFKNESNGKEAAVQYILKHLENNGIFKAFCTKGYKDNKIKEACNKSGK